MGYIRDKPSCHQERPVYPDKIKILQFLLDLLHGRKKLKDAALIMDGQDPVGHFKIVDPGNGHCFMQARAAESDDRLIPSSGSGKRLFKHISESF